ncbi:MAG TPA: ferrous iron transport protein A [Candidatus Protoclostridium stercorigallinarum]|uniref:Ferrous iron transport protein A n=1 Tax=Candidatus Protoclostridium stercorigallinarum TaxID=2838741 RepID=A0A9D1Q001_9FIRM|nr:ferrous iron transport protein A [Candidatus Protoclostridium stercorigallinarum]
MVKKVSEMRPGESGVVVNTRGEGWTRKRLLDMGVTKSAPITFRKSAPLGDPIEVIVRGYALSMRKNEAELVDVELSGAAEVKK